MSTITVSLLNDTLNVIALARETALARGGQDQANRLTPVVDGLRSVATAARQPKPAGPSAAASPAPVQPTGALAQADFQNLLAAAQKAPLTGAADPGRGMVAAAMAAGGMGEVDIARQLGISREEVRLMLSAPGSAGAGLKAYWR